MLTQHFHFGPPKMHKLPSHKQTTVLNWQVSLWGASPWHKLAGVVCPPGILAEKRAKASCPKRVGRWRDKLQVESGPFHARNGEHWEDAKEVDINNGTTSWRGEVGVRLSWESWNFLQVSRQEWYFADLDGLFGGNLFSKKKGNILFGGNDATMKGHLKKHISLIIFDTTFANPPTDRPTPRKSGSKSQIHQGERNSIVCSPPQKWCSFFSKSRELPWKSQLNLGGFLYQSLSKWMVYSHMIGDS